MRSMWMKRASKYLCVEFYQKRLLIYPLNLTEKGLQIFMRRIWPKRAYDLLRRIWPKKASDQCVESDWKGPPNIIMHWIWLKSAFKYLCVESDQKGPLIYALNLTEKGLQILLCEESDQTGSLIYALNLTEKGLQIYMRRIWPERARAYLKRGEGVQGFNPTHQNFRFFFWKVKRGRKKKRWGGEGGRLILLIC